jgi:hypothetical protein
VILFRRFLIDMVDHRRGASGDVHPPGRKAWEAFSPAVGVFSADRVLGARYILANAGPRVNTKST